MVATAGAGFLSMAAMMNPGFAHADGDDIGLVLGGSGTPDPGPDLRGVRRGHYLCPARRRHHGFYQATPDEPRRRSDVFTPEGLYPLTGVHTLQLNYPSAPTA